MIQQAILLVIDGMDVCNFTMADTPVMGGWHGRTAVAVAHTEIIGAGTAITPITHAMMGTGQNVIAHRPGRQTSGRPYTYVGDPARTIGDAAHDKGLLTCAVGKNEAAIALGGIDNLDISRLEADGVSAVDAAALAREVLACLPKLTPGGIMVVNFNGVDAAAHNQDVYATIAAVEAADRLVEKITQAVDLASTLIVIAADHGTNPLTGRHNPIPTPLVLINGAIEGRVNLGVAHNLEIAITISNSLGLDMPAGCLGRDLFRLAMQGGGTGDYRQEMEAQFSAYLASQTARHELATEGHG